MIIYPYPSILKNLDRWIKRKAPGVIRGNSLAELTTMQSIGVTGGNQTIFSCAILSYEMWLKPHQ